MSKILVTGDIHGNVKGYQTLISDCPQNGQITSIQIGDFGFGWLKETPVLPEGAKFIRGNHDDPALARKHPAYLGDYGYLSDHKLFYISGAHSIDKFMRVPGQSWWAEEELSWRQLADALDVYEGFKPEIVISHEAPATAALALLQTMSLKSAGRDYKIPCAYSRTGAALQQMFEIHQPKQWIFGHYHYDLQFSLKNEMTGQKFRTEFTCLAELSSMNIQTACEEKDGNRHTATTA